jgi:hypothetical protein
MPEHIRDAKIANQKIRDSVHSRPLDDTDTYTDFEREADTPSQPAPTAPAPTAPPSSVARPQATLEKTFTAARKGSDNRRGRSRAVTSSGLQRDQRAPSTVLLKSMIDDMSPEAQAARAHERDARTSNMLNMSFFQQQLTAQTQRADDLQRRLDEAHREHSRELFRLQRKYDQLKLEHMILQAGGNRRKHSRSRSYSSQSSSDDEPKRKHRRTDTRYSASSSSSRRRRSRSPVQERSSTRPSSSAHRRALTCHRTESRPEIIDVDAEDSPEVKEEEGSD